MENIKHLIQDRPEEAINLILSSNSVEADLWASALSEVYTDIERVWFEKILSKYEDVELRSKTASMLESVKTQALQRFDKTESSFLQSKEDLNPLWSWWKFNPDLFEEYKNLKWKFINNNDKYYSQETAQKKFEEIYETANANVYYRELKKKWITPITEMPPQTNIPWVSYWWNNVWWNFWDKKRAWFSEFVKEFSKGQN